MKSKKKVAKSPVRYRTSRLFDSTGDTPTSYFFMLNCLLHSRVHTGLESNTEFYDEDVNVYIAHLLNSQIYPEYMALNSHYIARDESDLARILAECDDNRHRYTVYKVNADHLLMSLGAFDSAGGDRPGRHPVFKTPRSVFLGRASAYYALASSYACKLTRGSSGLSATLRKLSEGIETYVKILSYMRGQYLGLIKRYSPGELFHLDLTIKEIERGEALETKRNEFLDTYHEWLQTGVNELKSKLAEQAKLLREIDPTFEFTPPP